MNIFVLDGNENQAVACVRSLARAGHSVVVGSTFSWSKAGWSRYANGSFTHPSPELDPLAFVKHIATEIQKHPPTLILPMTELSMLPLSEHRDLIFSAGGKLVMPSHSTVLKAFDKQHTTSLAASLGIATPHTWLINSPADAEQLAEAIHYPIILKPRSSNQLNEDGKLRASGKPLYASNAQEFRSAYASIAHRSPSTLAQEFVEGIGSGYFALMREGEVRAEFFHRRIRDVRATGSGSSLRVSIPPQPELRSAGLAILQALKWHGVGMVEFRVRPDGRPVFVEVNGRFWTSLPLAIHAGVDFPALLVKMAESGDVVSPANYCEGVRSRWFLGDVQHLVDTFAGPPAGFPGNFPKRLPTLLNFLKPVSGTYHDNFTIDDPLPEVGDWLHFAMHRIPGLFRKTKSRPPGGARGVLHVHSNYSDGEFTLPELKETFKTAGCRFACITDHAECFDDAKLERYISECQRLSNGDFLFVPGLEFRCEGGMHILGYGCTTPAHSTDPQEIIAHIHEHGGIAVIAHPADRMFSAIEDFLVLPHGIEVWNTKYDGRYAPRPRTFHLLQRMQRKKPTMRAFYGQDLHWKRQHRGLFVSLSSTALDKEKILDAFTQGEFSGTKGELHLPSTGQLDHDVMLRFELEHRKSDRLRNIAKYCKDAAGRFGLAVPKGVKAQLRRIF